MYLPSSAPLPQNSSMPPPQWQVDCCSRKMQNVGEAVSRAYAAVMCGASPQSMASWSPELVTSALQNSNYLTANNPPPTAEQIKPPSTISAADVARSPVAVPLNPVDWGAVCTAPPSKSQSLSTTPAIFAGPNGQPLQPMAARAPRWSNLCWALRNGVVDASQFDPAELSKLQYTCSQLGYVGNCPPPPDVALYLQQNRGSLPHISVTDEDLQGIPRAAEMGGMSCPASYALGGLSGIPWGDAGWGTDCGSRGNPGMFSDFAGSPWAALALVAVVALGVGFVIGR